MRPYKGIGALLDAWEAAGLGPAGHTLLLAGEFSDPAYRSEIVARAAALAGVRIDAERIPDEKVRFYFGAADATVLPYERVLTSSSINLAIAFATPVIAPRLPSLVESLGDADRLTYDPEAPAGLADALRLCADGDLANDREATRRLQSSIADRASTAAATLAIYRRVYGGRAFRRFRIL